MKEQVGPTKNGHYQTLFYFASKIQQKYHNTKWSLNAGVGPLLYSLNLRVKQFI